MPVTVAGAKLESRPIMVDVASFASTALRRGQRRELEEPVLVVAAAAAAVLSRRRLPTYYAKKRLYP
jgi:hypothetical protein